VPETVEYALSHGFIVRELRELKSFDQEWQKIFSYLLDDSNGMGFAIDLARMLITHEEGGLYMDLDFVISEWDSQIHHYFDFFGIDDYWVDINKTVLATWGFAVKPGHEIIAAHLRMFRDTFDKPVK
jgi:hypothetical protein